jgi:hypothetical protein
MCKQPPFALLRTLGSPWYRWRECTGSRKKKGSDIQGLSADLLEAARRRNLSSNSLAAYEGSFDERGNKVRQGRVTAWYSTPSFL